MSRETVRPINPYRSYARVPNPPPPLLSQAEIVARIEAVRLEEAPAVCPTCGSKTTTTTTRVCGGCGIEKLLSAFPVDRSRKLGVACWCKPCKAAANARVRTRRALRAIGRAS